MSLPFDSRSRRKTGNGTPRLSMVSLRASNSTMLKSPDQANIMFSMLWNCLMPIYMHSKSIQEKLPLVTPAKDTLIHDQTGKQWIGTKKHFDTYLTCVIVIVLHNKIKSCSICKQMMLELSQYQCVWVCVYACVRVCPCGCQK